MKCPKCNGSGQVEDPRVIGETMRIKRSRTDITLRDMARRMDLSAPYISDLELGRRGWTDDLKSRYLQALKTLNP